MSKEYHFMHMFFTFKGLISHFLPNNETKMVICALREYNRAVHYPRFGIGKTLKTVNYSYYMLDIMTANILKFQN